eukprot:COSAG01_NODE_8746_length_2671_cov_1.407379_4_plen_73_part_00
MAACVVAAVAGASARRETGAPPLVVSGPLRPFGRPALWAGILPTRRACLPRNIEGAILGRCHVDDDNYVMLP